MIFMSDVSAFG